MQNNRTNQATAAVSSLSLATCAGNALPPTSFVDTLLAELFPDDQSSDDVLAPFDYDGFLRREGFL